MVGHIIKFKSECIKLIHKIRVLTQRMMVPFQSISSYLSFINSYHIAHLLFAHGLLIICLLSIHLVRTDMNKSLNIGNFCGFEENVCAHDIVLMATNKII